MTFRLPHLLADRRGAAAIEFGLLAPAFILLFLGVLQVGFFMQAYNSLRNASADTARQVSVQYQVENRLTNSQISQLGVANATTAPYLLNADRLDVTVQTATTQRVPAVTELTLELTYELPTFLGFVGIDGPELNYVRPIFVTTG